MPPKGSKRDTGAPSLQFTAFQVIGFLNGKNVAANFVKSDPQSWWHSTRRTSDVDWDKEREGKRRKLMGDEDVLRQAEEELEREREGLDDEEEAKLMINVLKSAPEGKVKQPVVKPVEDEAQDPELAVDPMSRTIIIHPGSRTLRIGRASDAFPISVPNVIARRPLNYVPSNNKRKQRAGPIPAPAPFVPPPPPVVVRDQDSSMKSPDDDEDSDADEPIADPSIPLDPLTAKINSIRGDLKTRMRVFKLRGQGNGNAQAIAYNTEVVPEKTADYNDPNEVDWTDVNSPDAKEFYVGMKALKISDAEASGYTLRRPFDRGGFNTNGYTSTQEFLFDIEQIYLVTLEEELGITRSELKDYSVIFLIPDLYDHIYVREMTNLLLKGIGFKQLWLQQESICATFGAGISTACVIDIGAKTTSITCVEEGLVVSETRMVLDFGGDDITEFLHTLLMRTGFPYREIDLSGWSDFTLMEELKERMIVLSEADVGLNLYDFYVRKPGKPTSKYMLRAYDDVILAPYALFAPRIVDFEKKVIPQVTLWSKRVEDIVDIGGNVTTNAMRNSTRHLLPAAPLQVPQETNHDSLAPHSDMLQEEHSNASNTPARQATPLKESTPLPPPAPSGPKINLRLEASKIPLHVAVVESILAAGSEERMKKLSQNVLIVGGTGLIHNVGFAIESRITPLLTFRLAALANQVSIVPPPREIDPRILAWKGISTLSKLECSNDLWIRREDWECLGLRAVKERAFYFA